ncbi:NUDIX domain-containing protein [Acinetobacter qingfengensis]|uniref:Nudix hydrolase domain-containing protein n=1 Tax=Acinetobacter qingfengensis TaxID=1262585 RepID=A0A1E7R2X4_9GAMM|nr:NUDIX domain-containing protein [Acinetobacter qingfengensis]KAA8733842.1 NUDIX domain-containing protein [Acinetobacter qingfengensis]OEY93645.1 hypothetical protein BJI46_04165 [Acinetobacter qingfengensis]
MSNPNQPVIEVASAIILNAKGELLLVRKHNTFAFMQVGGKLEMGETPEQALQREVLEEIGCQIKTLQFIAVYKTQAANEANHALISHTFYVELDGIATVHAELAEMCWVNIASAQQLPLAPLTRDFILPWVQHNLTLLGITQA